MICATQPELNWIFSFKNIGFNIVSENDGHATKRQLRHLLTGPHQGETSIQEYLIVMSWFRWMNQSSVWKEKIFLDWEKTVFALKVISNMLLKNDFIQLPFTEEYFWTIWRKDGKCTLILLNIDAWMTFLLPIIEKSTRLPPLSSHQERLPDFRNTCLPNSVWEVCLKFSMRGWSV